MLHGTLSPIAGKPRVVNVYSIFNRDGISFCEDNSIEYLVSSYQRPLFLQQTEAVVVPQVYAKSQWVHVIQAYQRGS